MPLDPQVQALREAGAKPMPGVADGAKRHHAALADAIREGLVEAKAPV